MTQLTSIVPAWSELVTDPFDPHLQILTETLAALDGPADQSGLWPEAIWSALSAQHVSRWALPVEVGGEACDRIRLLQRYARVAEGSLAAAFILTQHDAGVRRLVTAITRAPAHAWLEMIAADEAFSTVGISQLTTSNRLGPQALKAVPDRHHGYRLDGMMPWVTAAEMADVIITGAVLADGRQLLIALPTDRPGLEVREPFPLAALQASCTSEVICQAVHVEERFLLAGPTNDVIAQPGATGTGGLETSALALGLARAAIKSIEAEAPQRASLLEPVEALAESWRDAWKSLHAAALGAPHALTSVQVRTQANNLALRATQAYLTVRKGSGFLRTDPAQRWARQALFFLVWSCPTPVAQTAIRDLAGLCET